MLFFSACSKQAPSTSIICASIKYFDIPTPLTFIPTQPATDNFIKLSGDLSVSQTLNFYIREMEILGWDIINLSGHNNPQEACLYCNKPIKQCAIFIQATNKKTIITIFINTVNPES